MSERIKIIITVNVASLYIEGIEYKGDLQIGRFEDIAEFGLQFVPSYFQFCCWN